jgi:hypothetical protein
MKRVRGEVGMVLSRVLRSQARWGRWARRRTDNGWRFVRRRLMPGAELTPRARQIYAALTTAVARRLAS